MKKLLKNEAGFTLLELLVVVAVIGVLAAIIVPQVGDLTGEADRNAAEASLSNLQTAFEQYRLTEGNGDYPADLDTIGVSDEEITYTTGDTTDDHPNGDDVDYVAVYDTTFENEDDETQEDTLFIDSDRTGVQVSTE